MRISTSITAWSLILACVPALAQDRPRAPQGSPGTVTLSLREYERLLERAARPDDRTVPPVQAAISRAELRARVDGRLVRGTLRLEGQVFRSGAVKLPIVTGATLFDARAGGQSVPILHDEDVHTAVFSGPAPIEAVLEWGVPLGTAPGRASIQLPGAHAGTVTAAVDLPGEPVDIRVDAGGYITRRQSSGGRTLVDLTLRTGQRALLSWGVRETASVPPAEARMLADVKSLWRIGEADVQVVTLVEIAMIRGDMGQFELRLPPGFEVTSISGGSLETTATKGDALVLNVRDPSERRHEFLLSAERSRETGSFRLEAPLVRVHGAQREAGEVAIEAAGTVDVTATGDDALRRMDVREAHASLRALTSQPLLAAFRYQRRPGEVRTLAVDVKRFPDAPVVAAIADRATATTLLTSEGRMLTQVELLVRNQAQPFVKVTLPPGATMLSVEVAGQAARPVQGSDGLRVPLLRTGFRPNGAYPVSFVYLHGGAPFARRGDARMTVAAIDLPITILDWELFVPDRYSVKAVGGNVIPETALVAATRVPGGGSGGGAYRPGPPTRGEIRGRVMDRQGNPLPGALVTLVGRNVRQAVVSDRSGAYLLYSVPPGRVTITSELQGFTSVRRNVDYDARPRLVNFTLDVRGTSEMVTVDEEAPVIVTGQGSGQGSGLGGVAPPDERPEASAADADLQRQASQNVLNLQRRIAGVLPVRVDVPRTGTSHRFVRPLVLGDETEVTIKYRRR